MEKNYPLMQGCNEWMLRSPGNVCQSQRGLTILKGLNGPWRLDENNRKSRGISRSLFENALSGL
jgi:hypothetical protein